MKKHTNLLKWAYLTLIYIAALAINLWFSHILDVNGLLIHGLLTFVYSIACTFDE